QRQARRPSLRFHPAARPLSTRRTDVMAGGGGMRELKSIRKAPNAMALDRSDLASLWELKRTKLVAGAVLVASLAVLIIARLLERHDPRFGVLAAFAEAAMIGGLAIGTPSFSRPFALPIPHTAIIPANH